MGAESSDARKTMFHRSAMLFVPLVFMSLCGVSAGQEDVPALIHKLKDKDGSVRRNAASALVEIGSAAVPALIAALKDEDTEVRWQSAFVLGRIGAAAVPALIAALKDED